MAHDEVVGTAGMGRLEEKSPDEQGGEAGGEELAHRGVRWRRSSAGVLSWFNEGLGYWVQWEPGADAPPLPPAWAGVASTEPVAGGEGGPAEGVAEVGGHRPNAMEARPSMRSPYRVVPILVAAFIVAVAAWQATRPPRHAGPADIAAAQALKGQCLAQTGGTPSSPRYSPSPVPCTQPNAAVKVVSVLVPGHPSPCPADGLVVQVLQPGVVGEPSECVVPVRR